MGGMRKGVKIWRLVLIRCLTRLVEFDQRHTVSVVACVGKVVVKG